MKVKGFVELLAWYNLSVVVCRVAQAAEFWHTEI